MPGVAVVVPTYRRPDALDACLDALARQRRIPDELVVVTRREDPGVAVARRHGVRTLDLDEPGVLAALVAGVRATSSEVLCFTDDDAVVPPEWTARLVDSLTADDEVGGVGGRDVVVHADGTIEAGEAPTVGRVTWYGRHRGGHHLGSGPPRDVAFLKGVNAAYRRRALGLPTSGLRGQGAQAHFEVAVGRFVRRRGWRLVYDPSITVDHHPAPRQGEDLRGAPTRRAVADASFNLVVAMGSPRGLLRVGYATLVGDRGAPGIGRAGLALVQGDATTVRRAGPSLRGTLAGGAALLAGRRIPFATFD